MSPFREVSLVPITESGASSQGARVMILGRRCGTDNKAMRAASVTIRDVARRAGYRLLLCDTRADLDVEREVIEELIAHRVEGILIAPVSDRSRDHLRRLARFGVPFVLVDRTIPGVDTDTVLGDSAGGSRQLVEHLIALGHRRIGMITESDAVSTARDRRRGYEAALTAAGLDTASELVVVTSVDPEGGREGMRKLLELEPPPTAVFTVNNLV